MTYGMEKWPLTNKAKHKLVTTETMLDRSIFNIFTGTEKQASG